MDDKFDLRRTRMSGCPSVVAELARRIDKAPGEAAIELSVKAGEPAVVVAVSPFLLKRLVDGYNLATRLLQSPDLPLLREECGRFKVLSRALAAELERVAGKGHKISADCWKVLSGGTAFDAVDELTSGTPGLVATPPPEVLAVGDMQPG